MKLGNLKIGFRLHGGFGLVVLFAVAMGVIAILGMLKLADLTSKMYRHPLAVSNAVRDVRANINAMHRSMKDVAIAKTDEEINNAGRIVDDYEQKTFISFDIIFQRFLGEQRNVTMAHQAFADWKIIRDEVIQLSLEGKRDKAVEITKGKGARHVAFMNDKIQVMIDFASNKAITFFDDAQETKNRIIRNTIIILVAMFVTSIIIALFITRSITVPVHNISRSVKEIAIGNLDQKIDINRSDEIGILSESVNQMVDNFTKVVKQANTIAAGNYTANIAPRSEKDELGVALQHMTKTLREVSEENERQNWLKTGQNELNDKMRGDMDLHSLSREIIIFLSKYIGAQVGALYVIDDDSNNELGLMGSYAFTKMKKLENKIKIGEGLVGQAALEKEMISVTEIPEGSVRISSATVDSDPYNVVVTPFIYEGNPLGVIELGSFKEFSDRSLEFLKMVMENIAIAVTSANAKSKMKDLLEKTQRQAEELQSQQEELRAANEELEEQTTTLKASEEELQVTNEELEENTQMLESQKTDIMQKNAELEKTRKDIEEKAEDLAVASKYKSEFLANMSHELRSPLNSLMLLSRKLKDNKEGNLTENQVESAKIIYNSGHDLLSLIDEILDLSKIEAGQMDIEIKEVSTGALSDNIKANFQHMAQEKGLEFSIELDKRVPKTILTDQKRLEQIIKNLLSNAVKFTQKGCIKVDLVLPAAGYTTSTGKLNTENAIAISVTDTGIGIPKDRQRSIFEAFQQAEGGTARNYGGTGLGLSISREMAKLLGGEIQLKSEEDKGSTFTLYLPIKHKAGTKSQPQKHKEQTQIRAPQRQEDKTKTTAPSIPDDRESLKEGDKIVLVVEDDANFAKILMEQCHENGFKCIVSSDGESGVKIAQDYLPDAIILDINLPGISGWAVLDTIKDNHEIRHIPVHIISAEESTLDALRKGAVGFLSKPVEKEQLEDVFNKFEEILGKELKDLLVIEDDKNLRKSVVQLIGNGDVKISEASTGKEAIKELESGKYDCVVLDLGLPDMSGFELLKKLEEKKDFVIPPVIIFTGKELTKEEDLALRKHSESIILKGVKSEDRLLDETALFLHRTIKKMPSKKKKMIVNLHEKDFLFKDKKVLVVDDDMRNLFALAGILNEKGVKVLEAENGIKAIKLLENDPDVNLVLMDIMMPGMDGYETMKKIREQKQFEKLPIIALTAKAMKEDRRKCIAAGASDYIPKPVDIERLLSMMRVWLYQ